MEDYYVRLSRGNIGGKCRKADVLSTDYLLSGNELWLATQPVMVETLTLDNTTAVMLSGNAAGQ